MICGIDEVGRGCVAGPLVVAGCILNKKIDGLRDSKKLSEKKREELFEKIYKNSSFEIIWFSNDEIDKIGLSACLKKAILYIKEKLNAQEFIMDGNTNFGIKGVKNLIKADDLIPEVSAASILAKVKRDEFMKNMHKIYPNYGYNTHKGYLTKAHLQNLKTYGLSPIQRKTFIIKELQASLFD